MMLGQATLERDKGQVPLSRQSAHGVLRQTAGPWAGLHTSVLCYC